MCIWLTISLSCLSLIDRSHLSNSIRETREIQEREARETRERQERREKDKDKKDKRDKRDECTANYTRAGEQRTRGHPRTRKRKKRTKQENKKTRTQSRGHAWETYQVKGTSSIRCWPLPRRAGSRLNENIGEKKTMRQMQVVGLDEVGSKVEGVQHTLCA
jgi:hypothetical protein